MTRDIVVIILDSVRKDFFDKYAKRLIELADVSFEQCRTASTWSAPSHASLLTGDLPSQHGVHSHNRDFSHISKEDLITSQMGDYRCSGASANFYITPAFNFEAIDVTPIVPYPQLSQGEKGHKLGISKTGLNKYKELMSKCLESGAPLSTLINSTAYKAIFKPFYNSDRLPAFFDEGGKNVLNQASSDVISAEQPIFYVMNLLEAHDPHSHVVGKYDADMHDVSYFWKSDDELTTDVVINENIEQNIEDIENYRALYSTAIDYLDKIIYDFIQEVEDNNNSETTFIITADHGENLAYPEDEYLLNHTSSITESLIHVPFLLINPPKGYDEKERGLFSHLDFGALINGIASEETPDVFSENVLTEVIGCGAKLDGIPAEDVGEELDDGPYHDRMIRSVVQEHHKYVWDSLGNSTKYELDPQKPCCQKEIGIEDGIISDLEKQFFDSGIKEYKSQAVANSSSTNLDDEAAERLKQLGYI